MCIRDRARRICCYAKAGETAVQGEDFGFIKFGSRVDLYLPCLLYTSDAADERSSVDLGGRRIIKKKK